MYKIRIINLAGCFFCACFLVSGLYFLADRMSVYASGFYRKQPPHQIVGTGFVPLKSKGWYFAGYKQDTIDLGNWTDQVSLSRVSAGDRKTLNRVISGFDTMKFYSRNYLRTDSSNIYLFDGVKPIVLTGSLADYRLTGKSSVPGFTAALPISKNSFVLRTVKSGLQNVLIKVTDGQIKATYVLEKQGDGLFSNDGMLTATNTPDKLFYSFYYRNQFLCLDTNLRILYKGKTIDTVSHAHIKVAYIKSSGQLTLASPPLSVNKQCSVNKNYLFIHSALKANNDLDTVFRNTSVIDVYGVKDGKYKESVYLSDLNREKMRDFRVFGNTLVSLHDHYLYFYHLDIN